MPLAKHDVYRCGELVVDMYQEADAIKADRQIIVEMRDMEDYTGEPHGYLSINTMVSSLHKKEITMRDWSENNPSAML